jgi:hypothetical protein
MPPPANSVEREEERRVNSRTLAIASVASATAAAVTSQLWIAGTWVAAAVTPVLVALISEAMHRPTERIARAWTSEREARAPQSISPTRTEPTAVTGTPGPVRVYRAGGGGSRSGPGSTMLTKRRIAVGTVAATAAMACVAGLLLLTTVDLVSGGSVGKGSGRLTLTGGGGDNKSAQQDQQKDTTQQQKQDSTGQRNNTPNREQTTTEPAPSNQPPSDTTPTTPPTQTSPSAPAPQTETP